MEWFSNWWGALELTEQILYCIAIPSSLLLIIQAILILAGAGGEGVDAGDGGFDVEGEFDYASGPRDFGAASMFTLQGVSSFFCVFSWGSLLLYRGGVPLALSVAASLVLGVLVMYAIAKIMLYLKKLAHCGTLEVKNLLGSSGTVYLRIPPKGEGRGKVTIRTSERLVEFDAISEADSIIENNAEVRVIDILGENVLVVERQ
jgi:membrane protein implicated in regulation of membrane protease activity